MTKASEEPLRPVPAPTKPNGELMTMKEIGDAADRYFAALANKATPDG